MMQPSWKGRRPSWKGRRERRKKPVGGVAFVVHSLLELLKRNFEAVIAGTYSVSVWSPCFGAHFSFLAGSFGVKGLVSPYTKGHSVNTKVGS